MGGGIQRFSLRDEQALRLVEEGRHYAASRYGARKKPRIHFLPLAKTLKVIFGGFAIANPLDSPVTEATEINERACGLN